MPTEEEARHAKAARVRKQIEELTSTARSSDGPALPESTHEDKDHEIKEGESPRDFIQRRMIELTRKATIEP